MEAEKPPSSPPTTATTKRGCFDWQLEHDYEGELLMSGYALSRRPIPDLLLNCDLPPPLKLFSPLPDDLPGPDTKPRLAAAPPDPPPPSRWPEDHLGSGHGGDSPSLRRALQLSQTRAREAEKKAEDAGATNHQLAVLLLEQSVRLSAHRLWAKMLEAEIGILQRKGLEPPDKGEERDGAAAASPGTTMATWCFALALCVGVGLALGSWLF